MTTTLVPTGNPQYLKEAKRAIQKEATDLIHCLVNECQHTTIDSRDVVNLTRRLSVYKDVWCENYGTGGYTTYALGRHAVHIAMHEAKRKGLIRKLNPGTNDCLWTVVRQQPSPLGSLGDIY